jgi:hypothetical protein
MFAPLWLLFACAPSADDSAAPDRDGDGVSGDADCDDRDPRIAPGLEEDCDRLDNDCDGLVDEADPDLTDGVTWFTDADGDGVGDGRASVVLCTREEGYVPSAGDCDDTDPAVAVSSTWYADEDGDGYGDSTASLSACGAPVDHVADATDCDDGEATVHPGAVEVCGTGLDEDCDGTSNECGPGGDAALADAADLVVTAGGAGTTLRLQESTEAPAALWVGAAEAGGEVGRFTWGGAGFDAELRYAGAGSDAAGSVITLVDLDADGEHDLLVGGTSTAWWVHGPLDGGALTDATATLTLSSGRVGGLASVGDLNEDAVEDVLVAVSGDRVAGHVMSGKVFGDVDVMDAIATIRGSSSISGAQLTPLGDIDGDGADDLALVDAQGTITLSGQGVVYLLPLPLTGDISLGDVAAQLYGPTASGGTGMNVTPVGDFDGDGLADLVVGAPGQDQGGTDAGAAWLLLGPVSAGSVSAASITVRGEVASEAVGRSVAALDADGDGGRDLALGVSADARAPGTTPGGVILLRGLTAGSWMSSDASARLYGAGPGSDTGRALAAPGDLDGDGMDELLVGAPGADGVFLLPGGVGY